MDQVLTVQRHDSGQPWGFRLQGGKDFRMQLSIKKVERNSPVDGYLRPGDAVMSIAHTDATQLTHGEAQQLIKGCGNSLVIAVRRGWVQDDNFKHLIHDKVKFSPATASQYRFN